MTVTVTEHRPLSVVASADPTNGDEPESAAPGELIGADGEVDIERTGSVVGRTWAAIWPKAAAFVLFLAVWQLVVWSHWKPEYLLPGPRPVLGELWKGIAHSWGGGTHLLDAVRTTMARAVKGYAIALVLGFAIGAVVSQWSVARRAVGSMIAGIQTMPSVAWFPLAFVLFKASDGSVLFVVVMGASPSIAMGLIAAVDQIPLLLVRASKVLGAGPLQRWRFVVLPASLPVLIGGLKQGWAFAWRSLLAAELLVLVPGHSSIGTVLDNARQAFDSKQVLAAMMLIFVVGLAIDSVLFGTLDRWIRRRHGLLPAS